MTRHKQDDHENDSPARGWFLVWVSAASEEPILIEHDLDVQNWEHYLIRVEGPYSRSGARLQALFRYRLML